MIFDKDGKVIYAENEKSPGEVSVSDMHLKFRCIVKADEIRRSRAQRPSLLSCKRLDA